MAVRLRLSRVGSKKNPHYRIVVADARSPRNGRFIEIIGKYNPQTEPSTAEIDKEKACFWLARGAKPSNAVERILDFTSTKAEFEKNKAKYLQEVSS